MDGTHVFRRSNCKGRRTIMAITKRAQAWAEMPCLGINTDSVGHALSAVAAG